MPEVSSNAPDYRVPIPAEYPICTCFMVTERDIEQAIRQLGLTMVKQIMDKTHAGCGCHSCHPDLELILERCARGEFKFPAPQAAETKLVSIPPAK